VTAWLGQQQRQQLVLQEWMQHQLQRKQAPAMIATAAS
jgi:hypothetical protein